MARLYADENLPLPTVTALRELGHDVVTIDDAGLGDRSVHAERPGHAGIIVCTFDRDFVALARRIHDAVRAAPTLDEQPVRVNRPSS